MSTGAEGQLKTPSLFVVLLAADKKQTFLGRRKLAGPTTTADRGSFVTERALILTEHV